MDTIEFNYIDSTLYIGLIHTKSDMVEKGDLTRFRCEKKEKYRVDKNRKNRYIYRYTIIYTNGYYT